jgi:hypothetical protein
MVPKVPSGVVVIRMPPLPHPTPSEPVHADVHVSIRDFSRALKAVSAVPLKLLMCACEATWYRSEHHAPLGAAAASSLPLHTSGVNPTSALLLHGAALDGYASVTCIISLLDNVGASAPLETAAV